MLARSEEKIETSRREQREEKSRSKRDGGVGEETEIEIPDKKLVKEKRKSLFARQRNLMERQSRWKTKRNREILSAWPSLDPIGRIPVCAADTANN